MIIPFSYFKSNAVDPATYNSYFLNETLGSISAGDSMDTLFTSKLFSARVVFRANKTGVSHTLIGKHQPTGNQRSFLLRRMSTGKFQLDISGNGSTIPFNIESVSTFDSLQWQDIILVVNDAAGSGLAKFKLYVNGTLVTMQVLTGTIPANITIFNSTANLYIGAYQAGATGIANGYFNQWGFTSDEITAGEVTTLYNSGQVLKLQNVCNNIAMNCYGGTWDGTKYVVTDHTGLNTVVSVNLLQYALNEQVSPYVNSVDVWIHAGQSNARGNEAMANLQAGRVGISDSFYVYSASAVNYNRISSTANNNQFGEPQTTFGIEFECTDLRKADKLNKQIQWLKYAVGGTSLATVAQGGTANNWNSASSGNLFDNLKTYITNTITANTARGLTTNFKGIVWIQGENDANDTGMANLYLTNLSAFQSALETHIGNSLYWYVCRMTPLARPGTTAVRQADADFVALDTSKRRLINMDDATLMADAIHLAAAGNVTVGQRVVTAIVADN